MVIKKEFNMNTQCIVEAIFISRQAACLIGKVVIEVEARWSH